MTYPDPAPPVAVGSIVVTPDFCHFGIITAQVDDVTWAVQLPGGESFNVDDTLARSMQPIGIADPEGEPASGSIVRTNLWTEMQLWAADGEYPMPEDGFVPGHFVVNSYCTIPATTTEGGAIKFVLMFSCNPMQTSYVSLIGAQSQVYP